MKALKPIQFDKARLPAEVARLEALLASTADLSEAKDVLPFFKANENVAAFLGFFALEIVNPDRIAHELDVSGDYRCDLVVGDSARRSYCFIEFEEAKRDSIFAGKGRATSEWGRRFEHGFSQIVDWFHRLDDESNTAKWSSLLGAPHVNYSGMLVLGRDAYLGPDEQARLRWRSERLKLNSKAVLCLTYDQLLRDIKDKLACARAIA